MQLRLCNSGRYEHRQQARECIVVVQRLVEVRSQDLKEAKMVGAATHISHSSADVSYELLFGSDARGNLLSGLKNVEDCAGCNAWGNAGGCRTELEADSGTMDRLELALTTALKPASSLSKHQ